jgi:ABC-2 type transport system permease protein
MSTITAYRRVLYQTFLNSLAKLLSLRFSFFLFVLAELASFFTFYLSIDFLFQNISSIGSWDRTRFMFFIFWWQSVMNIHSALAAPNFWNFSTELQSGNLDFRLVRPLGSLFDTFTAITRPIALGILPLNFGFLLYYGFQLHLSIPQWLALVPLLALSLLVTVLVELVISMAMFWTTEGDGINFIRIQCQQIQKWPDYLYPRAFRFSFTYILPLLASTTFCVRALFGEANWWEIPFLMCSAIALWIAVAKLWSCGLRRYESASS